MARPLFTKRPGHSSPEKRITPAPVITAIQRTCQDRLRVYPSRPVSSCAGCAETANRNNHEGMPRYDHPR